MNSNIQFIPQNAYSSNGQLSIPEHHGEIIPCKLQSTWRWRQPEESEQKNIVLTAGNKHVSIRCLDLLKKLKLTKEELSIIIKETNPEKRSIILKNIVAIKSTIEKQIRENLLLTFFSSKDSENLRRNNVKAFFEELQNIFDSGPISSGCLAMAFEAILDEYKQNPYDNFFALSKKLLEVISFAEDTDYVKPWLDEVIVSLENLISENPQDADQLYTLIDQVQTTHDKLSRPNIPAVENLTASQESIHRTQLRQFGNDESIKLYLGLNNWETEGNYAEACRRILKCFRTQSSRLDLSQLYLTSLPQDLHKMPWVEHLDVSTNEIQDLTPIAKLKYLITLDLSYQRMGMDGIQDFQPLRNLERLKSIKLLHMSGDHRILQNRLRMDLAHCDRIEWTDDWGKIRTFARQEGELLKAFLIRKDRTFRPLDEDIRSLTLASRASHREEPFFQETHTRHLKKKTSSEVELADFS